MLNMLNVRGDSGSRFRWVWGVVALGLLTGAPLARASDVPLPDMGGLAEAAALEPMPTLALYGRPAGADHLATVLDAVWQDAGPVREALAQLEASGYEVSASRSGYYPFLSVNAAQSDEDRTAATLSVIQPLWDGGRTGAQVDQAKALQAQALAHLQSVRLNLGLAATQAYLEICQADEAGRWWSQYLQALAALQGLVQRRVDQGASPQSDIDLAGARQQQALAGAAANVGQQAQARARLARLLHRQLVDAGWPAHSAQVPEAAVQGLLARQQWPDHPRHREAQQDLVVAQARVRSGRASLWPALSLQHVQQLEQVPVVGRVSMDMLALDVSKVPELALGDVVTLWGQSLPVERLAQSASTISYELLCRVQQRVFRHYQS
jgi:outer membrane protein TolC